MKDILMCFSVLALSTTGLSSLLSVDKSEFDGKWYIIERFLQRKPCGEVLYVKNGKLSPDDGFILNTDYKTYMFVGALSSSKQGMYLAVKDNEDYNRWLASYFKGICGVATAMLKCVELQTS